jgi:surface antigen
MTSFDDSSRSKLTLASKPRSGQSAPSLGLLSGENRSTKPIPVPTGDNLFGPETDKTDILSAQSQISAPATTRQLTFQEISGDTRVLTMTLPDTTEASVKRAPVVIKGHGRRPQAPPSPIPHHKRRLYVTLAGMISLILITGITLLTVTPLGHDLSQNFNSLTSHGSMVNNLNDDPNLIAQATATANTQRQTDGYDPTSGGGQTIGDGSGSLNWPKGQCTAWANYRYHELTGFWVSWSGDAWQWVAGARAAGWNVSTSPHVSSIIVLMPYVQGASSYGHVAVVESIVPNSNPTTVHTSNMNWWAGGGGWDIVSYVDFTVGSGVWFIWHS